MNKSELISAIQSNADIPKTVAEKALNALIDVVSNQLQQGDAVTLVGFGTFQVNQRAGRTGRNPATGEAIEIKAAKVPAFKPGKTLKDAING